MDTKKFFTIGQMSKQTGVNFNSLRYYEKIGILEPAYVDNQSGYRYYTLSQIHIVEAISLCVDLGIPLSQFNDFVDVESKNVDMNKIIEQGKQIANEKMRAIENKLNQLEQLQSKFEHTESCYGNPNPQRSFFEEKYLWLVPYDGKQGCNEYNKIFKSAMSKITKSGLKVGYDYGLIMFCGEEDKRYFFVDLDVSDETESAYAGFENIFHLPAGNYLSMTQKESDIKKASDIFGTLFNMSKNKIVIETEVLTRKLNFQSPRYEIRCLIPEYTKKA